MDWMDLKNPNNFHKWNDKRGGKAHKTSILDLFLDLASLMLSDTNILTEILSYHGSDHWPIELNIDNKGNPLKIPFTFEWFWIEHLVFLDKIKI
jgi:hypothetical protein